jgi:putative transcriptional regulator
MTLHNVRTLTQAHSLLFVVFAMSCAAFADEAKPVTAILLVARAELPDSNFKDSVVLVMNNIAPAPAGVIINRPTRIPVSTLFPDIERLATLDDKLYFGGPVQVDSVSFLFRADAPPEEAVKVVDDVYLSTNGELLRKLLSREKPMEGLRVLVGYSGWGPGQLEAEIARGDWTLQPADARAIFEGKSSHPWPEPSPQNVGPRT